MKNMGISLKKAERFLNRGEILFANVERELSAKYWRYKDIVLRLEKILMENEKLKNTKR